MIFTRQLKDSARPGGCAISRISHLHGHAHADRTSLSPPERSDRRRSARRLCARPLERTHDCRSLPLTLSLSLVTLAHATQPHRLSCSIAASPRAAAKQQQNPRDGASRVHLSHAPVACLSRMRALHDNPWRALASPGSSSSSRLLPERSLSAEYLTVRADHAQSSLR